MNKVPAVCVQVVDDHPVVRDGLTATINYQTDMKVTAKSANGQEALVDYRKYTPDVTLMDLRMPVMDGVTAIAAIRREFPDARIIVLTTYDGDEDIYKSLAAGAVGYLLKDAPMHEVLKAIRDVYRDRTQGCTSAAITPVKLVKNDKMSVREREVMGLMARGYTNQEISHALFIMESTVQTHVASICGKLAAVGL